MDQAVPNLMTAQDGPVLELEQSLLTNQSRIETWFRRQWKQTRAPIYSSVDLRNGGYKLSPVDTNLFPAGFNNLNPQFDALAVQAFQTAVERICPCAAGVLVVPESHTRNLYYWESVATLVSLIGKAGFEVRVGSADPVFAETRVMEPPSGRRVTVEPLHRNGDRVGVDGFDPCAVIMNNDMSGGRPPMLEGIAQPIVPPLALGWSNRTKTQHFTEYREVLSLIHI